MPASMHNGLVTQHRAPTRPQPRLRWRLESPRSGLVIRFTN